MKIGKLPRRRNRADHLIRILDRRAAPGAMWENFRYLVARYQQSPTRQAHVEAHAARCAWERTWLWHESVCI